MSNQWKLTLTLQDRDGAQRETNLYLPSLSTIGEAEALANIAADTIAGISNANIVKGRWTKTVPPTTAPPNDPTANIYERLVILFTDGVTFGAVSIPAPRPGAYDTAGPLRAVRIQEGTHPVAVAISQLQTVLEDAVLPDGSPFPTGEWVAGRTLNQCEEE